MPKRNRPHLTEYPAFRDMGIGFDNNDFTYHDKNLLIGKNGSGKTRFLKALDKYYRDTDPKRTVITLFCPEIHNSAPDNIPSLYDVIFGGDRVTDDFLIIAKKDCQSLIEDMIHSLSFSAKKAKAKAQDNLNRINSFFRILFDCELLPPSKGGLTQMRKNVSQPQVRIVPIEQGIREFSPGEYMLFHLSLFIFHLDYQDHQGNQKITVLIDEPELHLHPKALVNLMELLTSSPSVSCLWVASHSLFIMPLFSFNAIVYCNHDHICTLNRKTYSQIYDDLIGLDNTDAYELMYSIENWTNYTFVLQSFCLPEAITKKIKNDEQINKLLSYVRSVQGERPLKILDFGAGKFRLWECLNTMLTEEERDRLISYEAYEPYPECEVPQGIKFYEELIRINQKYDVIVMMNVLHEISPANWSEIFEKIHQLLEPSGVLILLEVYALTKGEQPHSDFGFLVLHDEQAKILFPHARLITDKSLSDKTNCWVISSDDLLISNPSDVKKAISSLERLSEIMLKLADSERIHIAKMPEIEKQVYKLERAHRAREYAFWSQQYINAHFAAIDMDTQRNSAEIKWIDFSPEKPFFPGESLNKK